MEQMELNLLQITKLFYTDIEIKNFVKRVFHSNFNNPTENKTLGGLGIWKYVILYLFNSLLHYLQQLGNWDF